MYVDKQCYLFKIEIKELKKENFLTKNYFYNLQQNLSCLIELFENLSKNKFLKIHIENYNKCKQFEKELSKNDEMKILKYHLPYSYMVDYRFLIKLVELINSSFKNPKIKFLDTSINLAYFPFMNQKKLNSKINRENINFKEIKNYIVLSINCLCFLKKNENLAIKLIQEKKNKDSGNHHFSLDNMNYIVLNFLEKCEIFSILKLIRERIIEINHWVENKKFTQEFSLSFIFIIMFLENILTSNHEIKIASKYLHIDIENILKKHSFNKINNIDDLMREINNFYAVNIPSSKKIDYSKGTIKDSKTISIVNFLLYLYDFLNMHEFYEKLLQILISTTKVENENILEILTTFLIIIKNKMELLKRNEFQFKQEKLFHYMIDNLENIVVNLFKRIRNTEKSFELKNAYCFHKPKFSIEIALSNYYLKDLPSQLIEQNLIYLKLKYRFLLKTLKSLEYKDSMVSRFIYSSLFWEKTILIDFILELLQEKLDDKNDYDNRNLLFANYFKNILIEIIVFLSIIVRKSTLEKILEDSEKNSNNINNKNLMKIISYLYFGLKKIEINVLSAKLFKNPRDKMCFFKLTENYIVLTKKFSKFEIKSKMILDIFNVIDLFLSSSNSFSNGLNEKNVKPLLYLIYELIDWTSLPKEKIDRLEFHKINLNYFQEKISYQDYWKIKKDMTEFNDFTFKLLSFCSNLDENSFGTRKKKKNIFCFNSRETNFCKFE